MKNLLVYIFGALGLGWLLDGAAKLAVPDLGAGRGLIVGGISMAIWVPIHRWLTHHDPGPCGAVCPPLVAGSDHACRCTRPADGHTWHGGACGVTWTPSATGLIMSTEPLAADQVVAFKAAWERAHGRDAAPHLGRDHVTARDDDIEAGACRCGDIATHNHGGRTYRDGKPVELHYTAAWRRPRAVIVRPAERHRFAVRLNRHGRVPGKTAVIGVAIQISGRALSILWAKPVHRFVEIGEA